ncbi:MAG: Bax inhibitor-1 family protein [Acutalibacteraceae bacterium]
MILTYGGSLSFVGLTAYDMQKLKNRLSIDDDESSIAKFAVLGALTLYLDFINLFLRLLQIFGSVKRL